MADTGLQQKLATLYARLAEGVFKKALDAKGLDGLHKTTADIAHTVLHSAEQIALRKCKALDGAMRKAFGLIGKDISKIEDRMKELEEAVDDLTKILEDK